MYFLCLMFKLVSEFLSVLLSQLFKSQYYIVSFRTQLFQWTTIKRESKLLHCNPIDQQWLWSVIIVHIKNYTSAAFLSIAETNLLGVVLALKRKNNIKMVTMVITRKNVFSPCFSGEKDISTNFDEKNSIVEYVWHLNFRRCSIAILSPPWTQRILWKLGRITWLT